MNSNNISLICCRADQFQLSIEIEEVISPAFLETIYDPGEIRKLELDLTGRVKEELLMILPSSAAFYHHQKEGLLGLIKEKAEKENLKVRILSRVDNQGVDGSKHYTIRKGYYQKKAEYQHDKKGVTTSRESKNNYAVQLMELEQQQE